MAIAIDVPGHAEQGAAPASAQGGFNHGESQRDLHDTSEYGAATAEQHVASPSNGVNPEQPHPEQSQPGLTGSSDEDPAAAKPHAESDNHGQQDDLHAASEDGPAAAEQHTASHGNGGGPKKSYPEQSQRDMRLSSDEDPAPAKLHDKHDNHGQSQDDLHAASEDGPAAAEQHAASHGNGGGPKKSHPEQSQHQLHVSSDEDPLVAKQHAGHVEHDAQGGASNHGQSQHDLDAASDDGSAVAEQHVASHGNEADPEQSDPGQSQQNLAVSSDEYPVAAKQNAGHGAGSSEHNQSQCDSNAASEDILVVAEQLAEHDATPGSGVHPGQGQHDLHAAPEKASGNPHSESDLNAGSKDQAATDGTSQAATAGAPALGDSFHFKAELDAFANSDTFEQADVSHGPGSAAHGQHGGGYDGLAPLHDADPLAHSFADQNAPDHAKAAHHVTHDLMV